jgi:hypothetical protein
MIFYTLPPKDIEWDYLLVNPKNYKELFERIFKHAILDSGVMIFHENPNLKDYPKNFINFWKHEAKRLTKIFGDRLWITIPDYPDDYHPGQFGDNVSKTIENIKEFIKIDGVNWIPVIQSNYLNIFSFIKSCEKIKEIIGDYPRIAIGTVCKTNSLKFIEYCCRIARGFFPKSHIHAFGLTLRALPKVKNFINSFDSLAYSFPRTRGHLCKNKKERIEYFYKYIKRVKDILKEVSE